MADGWESNEGKSTIKYKDHDGNWEPLQRLYWAGDILEVVGEKGSYVEATSIYCPWCFKPSKNESTSSVCQECLSCPICASMVVTVCELKGDFFLKCTHCFWDSFNILCAGSHEELNIAIDSAMNSTTLEQQSSFSQLVSHFSEYNTKSHQPPPKLEKESWQPADADSSQETKPSIITMSTSTNQRKFPSFSSAEYSSNQQPWTSLNQRIDNPSHQTSQVNQLLPLRPCLLSRKERRSVLEMERGFLGTMVIPKANPLEGDSSSSFKLMKSEWWKKRKMAAHFIPRIVLSSFPKMEDMKQKEYTVVRLKVSNPQPNRIKLWLRSVEMHGGHIEVMPSEASGIGLSEDNAIILEPLDDFKVGDDAVHEVLATTEAETDIKRPLVFRHHKDAVWLQLFLKDVGSSPDLVHSMVLSFELVKVSSDGSAGTNSTIQFQAKIDL